MHAYIRTPHTYVGSIICIDDRSHYLLHRNVRSVRYFGVVVVVVERGSWNI